VYIYIGQDYQTYVMSREVTRELPEDPYILHRKTMRAQDSSKVGGQRIHVSTLIQSNVYNIIR